MNRIRVGFVGVGYMGQCAHLRSYAALPECEVVAIAETRTELGRMVAQRYGVPRLYPDHREMLDKERLDGIVASQQFRRHGILVPQLLEAGIPVFTEKPLASSVEVGEQILRAVESSRTWHMVGYHKRSDPATMYAKTEIDRLKQSGQLGALRYVRILIPAGDWIAGGDADLIRSTEAVPDAEVDPPPRDMDAATRDAYVAFVNYYIHQLNLLRHLLGEPYAVTYADTSGVLLVAESESGLPGVIEMTPYATTLDWQESALVAFERGYLKLDLPAPLARNRPGRVEVLRDPGGDVAPQVEMPTLPWVDAMRQQAVNFLAAIKGEAEPPCSAAEALEDLRVARDYMTLMRGQ